MMVTSRAKEHKFAKESFDKTMESLDRKKINLYALFYRGFRTGMNYTKKNDNKIQP